jgi:ribosome recycling factor
MIDEILESAQEHFDKALTSFKRGCDKIRTGRANPSLLDGIRVEYYGQMVPLTQVSSVSVPEPRLLSIKPWEKSLVPVIEKAILASDLGLTPNNRGELILVPIPSLTGERRRDLVRVLKREAESAKVSMRHGRREALDMLAAFEGLSEDDVRKAKKKVQELVDDSTTSVEKTADEKEQEILKGI